MTYSFRLLVLDDLRFTRTLSHLNRAAQLSRITSPRPPIAVGSRPCRLRPHMWMLPVANER